MKYLPLLFTILLSAVLTQGCAGGVSNLQPPSGDASVSSDVLTSDTITSGDSINDASSADAPIPTPTEPSHLYIATHADDDLLFMGTDLATSIKSGVLVQTVFLSAGDANSTRAFADRENGIKAAYSLLATGQANYLTGWNCDDPIVATKKIHRCVLAAKPQVSVVFLRLPDNGIALPYLWEKKITTITPVDDSSTTYTRDQLIAVLNALMYGSLATRVGTQDSSHIYGVDHSDHLAAAHFAFAAHHHYSVNHELFIYRGYNIQYEEANLSADEQKSKMAVYNAYCVPAKEVAELCPPTSGNSFYLYTYRNYAITNIKNRTGMLAIWESYCLGLKDNNSASGTTLELKPCADETGQFWKLGSDNTIRGQDNKCLSLATNATVVGTAAVLDDCRNLAGQKWTLMSNGQLRGAEGKCLGADAAVAAAGVPLKLLDCSAETTAANQFTTAPSQRWTLQTSHNAHWGQVGQFSNTEINSQLYYSRTFRLADINGDGYVDACIRLSDGINCALNNKQNGLSANSLYSADFSDANGWNDNTTGTTIMFGDLNNDGRADVCGRATSGIYCALANDDGTGFTGYKKWSASDNFTNTQNWQTQETYYGTIKLADVNGDGFSDICGRGFNGILCALNNKNGQFESGSLWIDAFTDSASWNLPEYGMTIQFGDLNGDGRADVCGRASDIILCALANDHGTGFERAHRWSTRLDFTNTYGWNFAEHYLSIRLADINGDGRADICGRGSLGLVCAYSNGVNFDQMYPWNYREFSNALGWGNALYAANFQFGDLNSDGQTDVCGRGSAFLVCSW